MNVSRRFFNTEKDGYSAHSIVVYDDGRSDWSGDCDYDFYEEDGKYYPMMRVVHGEAEDYTACEYLYGRCLLRNQHPVLEKYLNRELQIKESVFCQLMKHKNSESAFSRMEELKTEMEMVKEALNYYP